ncbi:MAG: M1 family aminopeptidase [Pedobacter sp.]|uniref:M1 family aminopeptidase n=1 Tax=Pedobacter sp. TaxID=1411316 RepID=UPI003395E218
MSAIINYSRFKKHLFSSLVLSFLCSVSFAQSQLPANRMDYHFSWDGVSTILKMDIVYDSHDKDSTVFVYGHPRAGGQSHIFDILGNVNVKDGDHLKINPTERQIIVHHTGPGIKRLHAEIDGKLLSDMSHVLADEAFRPTIDPGFLYTMGFQVFMEVADTAYSKIGIVWDNYPAGMPYVISTDPMAKPGDLQVVPFTESDNKLVLMQMSKDLVVDKYMFGKTPHYLLTSKSDSTGGLPDKLKSFMNKYIPTIRSFWADDDVPFYMMSAIPLQHDVAPTMTGMGLPNAFSVRYRGPMNLEKTRVIAHEVSHNWVGVRLQYKEVAMENNWFNEGFNDYIALYNLSASGLFTQENFLDHMNKGNLTAHYTSPVRTMPGDSIQANFFISEYYENLPYQRGLIYAFYLDNQIRLASKGKKTIRHFLLALFQYDKKQGMRKITAEDFCAVIAPYLPGKNVAEEIKRYMLQGELIDFSKEKLIPEFKMTFNNGVPNVSLTAGAQLNKVFAKNF